MVEAAISVFISDETAKAQRSEVLHLAKVRSMVEIKCEPTFFSVL